MIFTVVGDIPDQSRVGFLSMLCFVPRLKLFLLDMDTCMHCYLEKITFLLATNIISVSLQLRTISGGRKTNRPIFFREHPFSQQDQDIRDANLPHLYQLQ